MALNQPQDFASSFAGMLNDDTRARRENRFAMKLKSQAIEDEMNSKRQLFQEQGYASPEVSSFLGAEAGMTGIPNGFQASEKDAAILGNLAGRKATAAGRSANSARPQARITDINGKKHVVFIDPNTREIVGKKELGMSDATYNKAVEAESQFSDLDSSFAGLKDMASKVLVSGNKLDALGGGLKARWGAFSQTNADASTFINLRKTFGKKIARAVEKGIVTQNDFEAIMDAIPDEFDTLETAEAGLSKAQEVFEKAKDAKIRAYVNGLDIGNIESKPKAGGKNKDPLGLGI